MTTVTSRNSCLVCAGCSKDYCKSHLQDHQKELELQLDEIENERNIFRQSLEGEDVCQSKNKTLSTVQSTYLY